MEQTVGPRFTSETGFQITGFAGGSQELANEIKSGVRQGDVFVSASPVVDANLEGRNNGAWVSWYVAFARAPLVLGYNPHSRFAEALRTRPWYQVVTSPGFLLGRTDSVLDPKGQLTVEAVDQTAKRTHDKALLRVTASSGNVFPEETLLGRLQAGQLDAAFFYSDEAKAAGIPTIALSPVSLSATFTITILRRAHDERGGLAFAQFLLSPNGQHALRSTGFEVLDPPQLHGSGAPRPVVVSATGR
jgi:molybdate/tungstate transport system substrate-binding protein